VPAPQVVVDTNVLVSGFLNPHGAPGRLVEWMRDGVVTPGLDDRILAEYREVLLRPEFGLPPEDVRLVLSSVVAHAVWARVDPEHADFDLPDPDDAMFAECAAALACPLVTGNLRHFPRTRMQSVKILRPAEFVGTVVGRRD